MGHLPYAGSVTVHVCVSMIELLLWKVMGQVPTLEYLLSGAHGLLWMYLIIARLSYPIFILKPSTHHMHDPGSIVPHIRPKVFKNNQMSRIKYNYYYINSVSKDYDDSQWNGTVEDSITPQERQSGQHVA
jgi:hypothetical protein